MYDYLKHAKKKKLLDAEGRTLDPSPRNKQNFHAHRLSFLKRMVCYGLLQISSNCKWENMGNRKFNSWFQYVSVISEVTPPHRPAKEVILDEELDKCLDKRFA